MIVVATFLFFLVGFTAVGVASSKVKKDTTEDYLVAGRDTPAWLAALSTVATNNSGYMFIGLIGFTYREGVSSLWLSLGWLAGDMVAWLFVYEGVRRCSERYGVASIPALLAYRDGAVDRVLAAVAGVLTFLFLGGYAAAQLKAGSAALNSLFGWDLSLGCCLGAVVVLIYCYSGGLRASIWTDAAQSMVMMGAMVVLVGAALLQVGGPGALMGRLAEIDPGLVRWTPQRAELGYGLYFLGFCFGGFGAVGAPHILVRAMAIESADEIPRARNIYYMWFLPFLLCSVAVGLYARVLVPKLAAVPAELAAASAEAQRLALVQGSEQALPALALALLPDVLIGVMLAGIFSATMSTADSQLLSCSAALTQDILPRYKDSYVASKVGTVGVTALSLGIALWADSGVFALVLDSWSLLGATLGPLLVLRLFGHVPGRTLSLAMMVVGAGATVGWKVAGLHQDVFMLLPGMVAPFGLYLVAGAVGGFPREPSAWQPEEEAP